MKVRVLCALALCMAMLFSLSVCAGAEQENGFNYYIENGEAVVYGYEGSKTSIAVPETLGGYTVTRLDYSCFDGYNHLTSVTLPNTLREIAANAFSGCTGLKSLEIPTGVTYIGGYAFSGCANLTDISLPDSLTDISYGLFDSCTSLKKIVLPPNVKVITNDLFENCPNLTDITIMGRYTACTDSLFWTVLDGRKTTFTVWENSKADSIWNRSFKDYTDITMKYLMEDVPFEQMTEVNVNNVDAPSSEEGIPAYIPSKEVMAPTLYLTEDVVYKAVDNNGNSVEAEDLNVAFELHKDTDDIVVYDLHFVSEEGATVSVTFDPPQALVLPYPGRITYRTAQGMQFHVEHEKDNGTVEYYSTTTGDLIRTPAGLLLYTSSFSPFAITWEENADPSALPQTGDASLPLGLLMAAAMLGTASVFALRRKRA